MKTFEFTFTDNTTSTFKGEKVTNCVATFQVLDSEDKVVAEIMSERIYFWEEVDRACDCGNESV